MANNQMSEIRVSGNIVDVFSKTIRHGTVVVKGRKILAFESMSDAVVEGNAYILPGFVDSHIHIESSMLIPSEFARAAVKHGTIAAVCDPHEIANVLGVDGVRFMVNNGKETNFKFLFGCPSCVPATTFETSGASISVDETKALLADDDIGFLSEMMNVPGVVLGFADVAAKLQAAKDAGKPIDGHAPAVSGEWLVKYVNGGASTDHESSTMEEAREKVKLGLKILIREGSAAKNYDALWPLLKESPKSCMFCSDDRHPDELERRHINDHVRRSVVDHKIPLFDVLYAASVHPKNHYTLDLGLLQIGDDADFIVVNDLKSFTVQKTFIRGETVFDNGTVLLPRKEVKPSNLFEALPKKADDFAVRAKDSCKHIRVIGCKDGELLTTCLEEDALIEDGFLMADPTRDLLKITVVNRYENVRPAVAFVKGFGFQKGAIASSVAHDSHNIIAVGTSDEYLCRAVNSVIGCRGGVASVSENGMNQLPLPIAGLMSDASHEEVARLYKEVDRAAIDLGGEMSAPFMTLSFLALLVIPELKLSDKGLFDGRANSFCFCDVCIQ